MPRFRKRTFLTLYKKPYSCKPRTVKTATPVKKHTGVKTTPRVTKLCVYNKRCLTFSPNKTPKRKRTLLKSASLERPFDLLKRNDICIRKKLQFNNKVYDSNNTTDDTFLKVGLQSSNNSKNTEQINTPVANESTANITSNDDSLDHFNFQSTEHEEENNEIIIDLNETIQRLTRLVKEEKYSTSSISYKLFEDTLKWYDSENTSAMRYSEATKDFFWTGQKLLGGQFLRFMRGFTNEGQVKERHSAMGSYNPTDSDINLPVPSDRILREYKPAGVLSEERVDPGIIRQNIETYSNSMVDTSFTVMFDGKKIIPQSADIFLLDQEDEPKLSQTTKKFEDDLETVYEYKNILETLQDSGINSISDVKSDNQIKQYIVSCKNTIFVLSCGTRELRKAYAKKALYLQACEKKLSETNDAKYKFVINRIRTLMYQMNICIKGILEVIDVIAGSCSVVNGSSNVFNTGHCNLTTQQNYRELRDDLTDIFQDLPSEYLKQRSTAWFDLRKSVRVTGSVAHTAIGLESLISQKKYFDSVFIDNQETSKKVTDTAKFAMEHGVNNEVNALATLVSKVIPVYYPTFKFHEEGAYVLKNEKDENILIISPDGSIRDNDRLVSIELKCPFSQFVGSTPVYYAVKPRHVVQSLLEADVTKAYEHLYISWSKESTTVFRMNPNKDAINNVVEEVNNIYYTDAPIRPKKLSEKAKTLKSDIHDIAAQAEFLGEFSSVFANSSNRKVTTGADITNIYYQQEEDECPINNCIRETGILIENAHRGIKYLNEAFQKRKPMASEVLVYLMSDMDRSWHREIGHGLPIAYLFKGYSLSMSTSRRILDLVLNACKDQGAHVPCTSFDGQFARLKDYDEKDNPLTMFCLQRKVWSDVKRLNKKQLLDNIEALFTNPTYTLVSDAGIDVKGVLQVRRKFYEIHNRTHCLPIKTTTGILHRKEDVNQKSKVIGDGIRLSDSAGLEDTVLEILENVEAVPEKEQTTTEGDIAADQNVETLCEETNTENAEENCLIFKEKSAGVDDNVVETIQNKDYTPEIEPNTPGNAKVSTSTVERSSERANTGNAEGKKSVLKDNKRLILEIETRDFENLLKLLCETKRPKWKNFDTSQLMNAFNSPEAMNEAFIANELNKIINYLSVKLINIGIYIRQNMRKAEKINLLCTAIGHMSQLTVPACQRKKVTVKSLRNLCLKELNKKEYPKEALAASYGRCIWPFKRDEWYKTSAVDSNIVLENLEEEEDNTLKYTPIYSPEYCCNRDQLEVRVMDGTHIRTNIKSKLIRTGLGQIKLGPWKRVANCGATLLTTSMLEVRDDGRIMHQQSDPFVRTMFCEDVEQQMLRHGDSEAAKFCKLFRQWHEAEDQPGISAFNRCLRSAALREWLLEGYDFSHFPPPTQYVRGIPRVTFEGLVCSIEAHFLLYTLVKSGTYNWRSVSTLVAENFMGELAERCSNSNGVPSGKSLPNDMCKISQLHAMRLKPDRSFKMKTAKSRCYAVPDHMLTREDGSKTPTDDNPLKISHIYIRDHHFDRREQHKAKHGKISSFDDAPRGVQSVRQNYKVDESKILPSLRLGISSSEIKDLLS